MNTIYFCVRYKDNNVRGQETYKRYSADVPEYLRNRPHNFIAHAMKRLPPKAVIRAEDIKAHDETHYTVRSQQQNNRDQYYEVTLDGPLPSCQCEDWSQYHLPCKHMWSLVENKLVCYNQFPQQYTECPMFTLDSTFIQGILSRPLK